MTEQEFLKRLSQHEWKDIEFKEAKEAVSKEAYKTVSAFANTDGGYLVFGVKKDDADFEIVGVANVDKIQNEFLSTLRQKDKFSTIIDVKANLHTVTGKSVLVFYVPEVLRKDKPVYLNGSIKRSFLRKGACDVECTQNELNRFLTDASIERYDSSTLDFDIGKCFNEKDIVWYRQRYESKADNRSYADLSNEDFLFQFGLIKDTSSGRKPTVASILLFGQDGSLHGILPRPIMDCQRYLYKSEHIGEGRWHDRTVCEYNLVQAWVSIMEWFYRFAEIPFKIDPETLQRKDEPVGFVAFRESIINTLIHQDYADHSRKPVIQHYADLTRFWNPGDAFDTDSNLLTPGEKENRNPLIVTVFRRIGLSENAGWGLREAYKSWRGLGYVPPELTNDKSKKAFELILKKDILLTDDQLNFHQTIGVPLSEDEAVVFAYACKKKTPLSLTDLEGVLIQSKSRCLDVTKQLIKNALLIQNFENTFELAPRIKKILHKWESDVVYHEGIYESQMKAQVKSLGLRKAQERPKKGPRKAQERLFLDEKMSQEAHVKFDFNLTPTEQKILSVLRKEQKSGQELLQATGYKSRTGNFKRSLEKLLSNEMIQMTIPENPKDRNQKYIISEHGSRLFEAWEASSD